MDVARVGGIVLLMLLPTLAAAALVILPRAVRAGRRVLGGRTHGAAMAPCRRPIEQVAADLRRLLQRHDALRGSTDVVLRARRLHALEAAIADCAVEAAGALGVPSPPRPVHGPMAKSELGTLLHALLGAGVVLPSTAGLLAAGGHC